MARFNIYTGNHIPSARISIEDHIVWVKSGLEALGHTVTVSDRDISKSAMNILFEYFAPPFAEVMRSSGVEYIIIMTEFADGSGFNGRRDESWVVRWREFWRAAHGARAIWTLFEGNERAMEFPAPASYLELGFTEALVPTGDVEPTYDFGFFGSVNSHRAKIIDALGQRTTGVLTPQGIQPAHVLTQQISAIRILIDPRGPNLIPMPSITRCGRGIHAKRGVLTEHVPMTQGLTKLVPMTPKAGADEFIEYAMARLSQPWKQEAEETFEIARTTMPMSLCVKRALDAALKPALRSAGRGSRPKMPEWRLLADLTAGPEAATMFLERTLPSLLTRRNCPELAQRTTLSADMICMKDDLDRISAHPAYVDFRKMAFCNLSWMEEVRTSGEAQSPLGLTPDLGRQMHNMVQRWAKAPVYLMRMDRGRVFSDGALTALFSRALEVEKKTGSYPGNLVGPLLSVRPSALPEWAKYQPWIRHNDGNLEPAIVNGAHDLARSVLAGFGSVDREGAACDTFRHGCALYLAGGDALVLAPISPVSLATLGSSIPVGKAATAWRSEPGNTSILKDSEECLVLELSDDLGKLAPMSPFDVLDRLASIDLLVRPDALVTQRRKAWIATADWQQTMVVHAGEIDAIALARAEGSADLLRRMLRSEGVSTIIRPDQGTSPSIPPTGSRDQRPAMIEAALAE